MIRFNDVCKSFGKNKVLEKINLEIKHGENVAVLGPNGVGKTVFINLILDKLTPDAGNIERGFNIKQDVGLMEQFDFFPDSIKVIELLNIYQAYFGKILNQEKLLEEFDLYKKKDDYIKNLSGGQKRQLSFLTSIVNYPKFLILDEPTVGMDLEAINRFWHKIVKLKREKSMTTLITLHHLDELNDYCDRFIFLKNKSIFKDISKNDLDGQYVYILSGDIKALNILKNKLEGYLINTQLICFQNIDELYEEIKSYNLKVEKRPLSIKDLYEKIYKDRSEKWLR